ncbi:MAG: DNA polymerase I, partial [Clostridia bacterium]|nr:DNA polymerase I [Clostridia bacterium]
QLITDKTNILLAGNNDTVTYDKTVFFERYGVTPDTFVDVKALMGDSSDNIPGVPGIGEKTALKLISEFGSLDGIYDNLDSASIAKGVRAKLEANKDSAYLSQTLAKIDTNVPIISELDQIKYPGVDRIGLYEFFKELDFGALIKRLGLEDQNTQHEQTIKAPEAKREVISIDTDQLYKLANKSEVLSLSVIEFESEFSVSVSIDSGSEYKCNLSKNELADFVSKYSRKLIVFDLKNLFALLDIDPLTEFMFDIKLGAYVCDSSLGKYDLPDLARKYLGEETDDKSHTNSSLIFRLYLPIRSELESTGAMSVLTDIEQPLSGVLYSMEKEGFKIDRSGLVSFGDRLGEMAKDVAERIYFAAGCEFNINSPKQLGEILFVKLGIPSSKKTKSGYSTSAEVLEKLAPYYPIISDILDYRQIVKLKSTYTDALAVIADKNDLVHTSFNQMVTATGRLSSTEPNLQNIPIRTELGRELRKYFIPHSVNRVLIDADYSQIELRLLAHISGDKNMINAFLSGVDIHTMTASEVFGVDVNDVTPEMRKRAKAVNFGIVYGIGDFSLAQDIGVSKREAAEYIEGYKASYPQIDKYLKSVIASAHEHGYVTTEFGRRRYIPELSSGKAMLKKFGERVAMNSPIQGTAADVIKIAMINTFKKLKEAKIDAKLVLQVHDELIIDADASCADKALDILKSEMESVGSFKVPLTSEISTGDTWYDCK